MTDALLLREQDRREILRLLARHLPDVTAWAYGSRVNGGAHEGSDLDIVLRSPDLSPIPLEELRAFVQALRDSNIPILVEARDWARLPGSFQREIMKNYVVLRETVREWTCRLDEIAEIVDCEHKTAPTVDSSIYHSIRTTDITNGIIDYNNANCVGYETYLEWTRRAVPEAHDIILAREAPVGEVGWIREGERVCLGQRTVLIKVKSDNVSKRFLLYYLINPETKYELQVQSAGSVVSHLNMKNIRAFPVSLPSLPEQKAIASVLSSLDDKIDMLRRQNKTLEAMAEALFRQWFVEEAGEDWEIVQVKDLCHLQYGLTQSASVENIGPKFVRITDIQGGKVTWKNVPYCHVSKKDINKYHLKSGDILVARTGASTGENFYVYNPPESIFASYLVRMQFASIHIARFISIHLRSDDYFDYIEGIVSGSAQPNANAQMLASFEVKMPPEEKIIKFYNWIKHIDEKIYGNEMQIRTLEQLRDTLLPKLMSGEVRVAC